MLFPLFIFFLIGLRMGELLLARRNEKWLLQQGAVEYGQKHYPLIVMLHVFFFVSLIVEYLIVEPSSYSLPLFLLFFILLAFKVWTILALGKFWNTKIYRVTAFPLIKKGPYRYLKHPNYIQVIAEIAIIPLIFHLYYTAVIFSVLNLIVLTVRMREENRALAI